MGLNVDNADVSEKFFSKNKKQNQSAPETNVPETPTNTNSTNTASIAKTDDQNKQNRVVIYRTRNGEPRSKRTLVSLTPTDFENVKKRASQIGISMNEYVNRLIQKDLYGV